MMNEKKNYKVHIFGDQYFLVSDDSEVLVEKAAKMVDMLMKEIDQHSVTLDPKKVAVLAALRMANSLLTSEHIYNEEQKKKIALIEYINQELSAVNV